MNNDTTDKPDDKLERLRGLYQRWYTASTAVNGGEAGVLRGCADDLKAVTETLDEPATTMTVKCPCGWTATGPATHVQKTVFHHRCAQTDPTWNQQELDGDPRA